MENFKKQLDETTRQIRELNRHIENGGNFELVLVMEDGRALSRPAGFPDHELQKLKLKTD